MMGRITQGMMNTQFLRNLNANLSQMTHYQNQMSTGRTINKPSDNPVGLSFAMRYRSDITANDQYKSNIDSSTSWLEFSDTLLDQGGAILQRVRELSLQGANGSNSQGALDAIRKEVLELSKQLVTIGNSQFNGKYVFNGQLTDKMPYSEVIDDFPQDVPARGGSAVGNVNVNAANVTASDNVLGISVDGQAATVSVPPHDYAVGGAGALAADLQTAINSSLTGAAVTVSVGATGQLVITSNSTGAASSVDVTGGSFAPSWLSTAGNLSDVTKTVGADEVKRGILIHAQQSTTDSKPIEFEISVGARIAVNITGEAIYGSPTDDDNVFKVLNNLYNHLSAGDTAAVSNLLGNLDKRMNTFLEMRADVGAKLNRIELANQRTQDLNINLQTLLSKTEDADMAELITTLKTYENVYQASLAVGSRIISTSLVDFLK